MDCDAQRAAADAGVEGPPCPMRRGMISGLATIVATASIPRAATVQDQYEAALNYFHREFMEAASRLGEADGKSQEAMYRHMIALATALSVVPPATPRAWRLRREVANWSFQEGRFALRLPSELVAALSDEIRV